MTKIIRVAEKEYYGSKLLEMKDSVSKTWKLLNQMTGRNSVKNNRCVSEIEFNGALITDPEFIANKFNAYFTNIGPELAKKIPRGNKTPSSFLKGDFPDSMFFTPVFEYEISDIISNLKNSTSMGHDNLPISLLKSCNLELSPILAHLTNESLSSGVFPDTLKIAKVIPVFKSGDN